ncbi:MAG: hypothetical protein EBQ51_02350, partial [Verrucomicrobia bacterium]|nr:hypothetical protein [Verrucomicrobiota bacterium]
MSSGAQWIGDRKRKTTGKQPSPFLRKSFLLPNPLRKATLHWTALGVADLHLNGQKIGRDFLMPGWSDYRKRVQILSPMSPNSCSPVPTGSAPSSATAGTAAT